MKCAERPDDFERRREHLRRMSDQELHDYFWQLVDRIVEPLIDEARSHTTPSVERSVLMRMGFSSIEARELVSEFQQRDLLGHGAGHLVLKLAQTRRLDIHDAGRALLDGQYWAELGA